VVGKVGDYPSTLNDRYHLLRVIGSGGMGVVWQAHDEVLNRQVACKILSGAIADDPVFQERFRREGRHIASLSHPNIVTVFDSGAEGDFAYIVMEYVHGASLRHVLTRLGTLPVDLTAALAVDVLAGLAHAHDRGIVHRDVKPANLLLVSGGTVKVADFGIAKSLGEVTGVTGTGEFVGTSGYASPEQLASNLVGPLSDLYSLACVVFHCLTGQRPYGSGERGHEVLQHRFANTPSPKDYRGDIPLELSDTVTHALAKDPSDRFKSATDMREAFLPFADEASLHKLLERPEFVRADDNTERSAARVVPNRLAESPPTKTLPSPASRSRAGTFRRRIPWIIGAGVILIGALAAVLLSLQQGGGKTALDSVIPAGGFLQPSHSITSSNGRFSLAMQADGNLVEYGEPGKSVLWESGTSGNFGAYVVMQADGNLVVYPFGKSAPAPGQPTPALWQSVTWGHPGASAALLNTGVLEVRSSTGHVLWEARRNS
jgi:serine/threonine protein kinase